MSPTIICVDDDKYLLSTLAEQIRGWVGQNYTVEKALSGAEALEILEDCIKSNDPVPLVISDYIMPSMNGAELLTKINNIDKSIKKIMLTGYLAAEGIVSAINNASLYRFVSKPWNNKDLMLTVMEALRSYENEKKNQVLLQSFEKLYRGYENQIDYLLVTMSNAIDRKTCTEPGNSQAVAKLANSIALKAGLSADAVKSLRTMAYLHNIGRLLLDEEDLKTIKQKEALIYDLPELIEKQNKAAESIFTANPASDAAYLSGIVNQFEKFNGTGARGITGMNIPIEGRIIGLTNFYVVLTSSECMMDRPLKSTSAVSMINSLKNSFFDPTLVDILAGLDLE